MMLDKIDQIVETDKNYDYFQLLSIIFDYFWLLPITPDYFQLFPNTSVYFRLFPIISVYLPIIYDYLWLFTINFDHFTVFLLFVPLGLLEFPNLPCAQPCDLWTPKFISVFQVRNIFRTGTQN